MKRYVLKDKVLFDWLCANSDDFYEEFQKACAQSFENEYFGFICLSFSTNENSVLWEDEVEVIFKKTAIECIEVYDPYTWNNYPEITPPEGVPMRVEALNNKRFCGIYLKYKDDYFWFDENLKNHREDVVRFRPWED